MRERFILNPGAMIVRLDCLFSFTVLDYILVFQERDFYNCFEKSKEKS